MRRLVPHCADGVDVLDEQFGLTRHHPRRPWVMVNMVMTADGAFAIDGTSSAIGGEGDRRMFHALRARADVILVGAGTVRAEGYGPVRPSDDARRARLAAGLDPVARVAVVSRSLTLDWSGPLFTEASVPTAVITSRAAYPQRKAHARDAGVLVEAGDEEVDLSAALDELGRLGAAVVLCEGGPSLNRRLLEAGVVDELCLTISSKLGGERHGVMGEGPPLSDVSLDRAWVDGEDLLLRYLFTRAEAG